MRQAGTDRRDRKRALNSLVKRRDQRLELDRAEKLDLIEEEDNARVVIADRLAKGDEEIGEVFGELAAVSDAFERVDVDPRSHGAVGGDRELERAENGGRALRAFFQRALGAACKNARLTSSPIRPPNSVSW